MSCPSSQTKLILETYADPHLCRYGLNTIELAFAFALIVDVVLQAYSYFLVWRHKAKLLEYFRFSAASSFGAGVYAP